MWCWQAEPCSENQPSTRTAMEGGPRLHGHPPRRPGSPSLNVWPRTVGSQRGKGAVSPRNSHRETPRWHFHSAKPSQAERGRRRGPSTCCGHVRGLCDWGPPIFTPTVDTEGCSGRYLEVSMLRQETPGLGRPFCRQNAPVRPDVSSKQETALQVLRPPRPRPRSSAGRGRWGV